MNNVSISFVLGCGVFFGGCTDLLDPEGGAGAGGKADEINPDDAENLGMLSIEAPTLPTPALPFRLYYRLKPREVGMEYRVLKGDGELQIGTDGLGVAQGRNIPIAAGETTTVSLAAFSVRWDFGTDFGRPWLALKEGDTTIISPQPRDTFTGAESTPVMLLPGVYTFDPYYAVLGPTTVTLAPGSFERVDFSANKHATLRVHKPQRSFSQPDVGPCSGAKRHFLVERGQTFTNTLPYPEPRPAAVSTQEMSAPDGIILWKDFDLAQDTTFRILPRIAADAPVHDEYVVNNTAMEVNLSPGQTMDLYVKRIDVNDVRVTREDGSTYYTTGTWSARQEIAPDQWRPVALYSGSSCSNVPAPDTVFPTKTGLDVVPGRYKVTIQYSTAEGPKTQEHILNLQ